MRPSNGARRSPPPAATKESPAPDVGTFGLVLFLISLGVLFVATLVAWAVVRARAPEWPPADLPPPPAGLWVSTLLLLASSATVQLARESARRGRGRRLKIGMAATLGLAVAFLASQVANWLELSGGGATVRSSLWAFLFYVVTGLHALHVLGGLVPLTVVTVNTFHDRYSALFHGGVRYVTIYWHFLGVVWLVLVGVLTLG